MAENEAEKTEAPTPRRLAEARKDGNVARSTDLTAACMLLVGVVLLDVFGNRVLGGMKRSVQLMLSGEYGGNPTRSDDISGLISFSANLFTTSLAPIILAIMAVALVATIGQVGFLVTTKSLTPDIGRISPLKGAKNMFNARAGVRLAMSLLKIAIIAAVAIIVIVMELPAIVHVGQLQPVQGVAAVGQLIYSLAMKLAVVLIILAIFDYAFQRFQRQRELKMSKHEIKEEMKRMEGDPMTKQRRARVARQLAMQRIAQAVPNADVIVTNPTHYSVALKYDSQTMRAPKVIAKGADFLALRIRQIALSNDIPIVERKPLARALYHGVEIGQEVPQENYAAVAEILAYVYRLSGRTSTAPAA